MKVVLLGVDPGLAHLGYARASLIEKAPFLEVEKLGFLTSEKSDKKVRVLAGDDDFRRTQEQAKGFGQLVEGVRIVTVEGASWPRNSRACQLIGRSWGIVGTFTALQGIPVASASPQAIKKKLCGNMKASKEEVQQALDTMFNNTLVPLLEAAGFKAKGDWEHAYDALASIVTCLDSEIVRMAAQMLRLPMVSVVAGSP